MRKSPKSLSPVFKGFEHIQRSWDFKYKMVMAHINPGEYYVTKSEEVLVTVLGSCVAACIRDTQSRIGGINHFMLPDVKTDIEKNQIVNKQTQYGTWAMEHLINDILKYGGHKNTLEIKVFGGGSIIERMTSSGVGVRNVDFTINYLKKEGFFIKSQDLGGQHPRKVVYFPRTGEVFVKKLKEEDDLKIKERDMKYHKDITDNDISGGIELFE